MLDISFGQASHPGKLRHNNEDAMGAFVPSSPQEALFRGWMFAVADGAGGLGLGDFASTRAIEIVTAGFARAPREASLTSLLPRLIEQTNAALREEASQPRHSSNPMATTLVLCALRHNYAVISHVGDSRCYRLRDGLAVAVTYDHTLVSEQHRLGLISEEEATHSAVRHLLTRSLGPEQSISAETKTLPLVGGDLLVLCSDGLYGSMYDEDIARIALQKRNAQAIAEELVGYAVEVDGSDNATAQVISVQSV